MNFYPTNSSYKSQTRRDSRSRLTQTYTSTSKPPYPTGTEESPAQVPRIHKSASFRIPRKTSLSLLSRVSKFEALDALSDPIQIPSLRPAHLSVSRNSPSRKYESSHARKLASIFSPNNESRNQHKTFTSKDDCRSDREIGPSTTSKKWFSSTNKAPSRKLRKSQPSDESSNGQRRRSLREAAHTHRGKETIPVAAPYVQNEAPTRRKTIRDMIRLYDGGADRGASKVPLNENKPQKEQLTHVTKQVTSVSYKHARDEYQSTASSTASSRHQALNGHPATPYSTTKSYQNFTASQRQPLNEPHTAKTTSTFKSSPSKSSTSNVSPRTKNRAKACYQCGARSDKSILPSTPNKIAPGTSRQEVPSAGRRRKPAMVVDRGRTLVRTAGNEIPIKSVSERRDISNKIEDLYRAKSLERSHEILRRVSSLQNIATARAELPPRTGISQKKDLEIERGKMQSRVANIRRKFERATPPKAPVVSPSLPVFSDISPFRKDRKVISEKPPAPVFLPFSISNRTSNSVSPKSMRAPPTIDAKQLRTAIQDQAPPESLVTVPRKQTTKPRGIIRDRVELFERRIEETKKQEPEKRKGNYARRIRSSMRSFFEPSSRKSHENEGAGLSNHEVQEIIDDFQDQEAASKVGKKNNLAGKWNTISVIPQTSGTDGTMSERGNSSPCALGGKQMIVKEVECGLKEPKPVRATEMKRMVLLCRERVGGIIDKERGRIVQARKL